MQNCIFFLEKEQKFNLPCDCKGVYKCLLITEIWIEPEFIQWFKTIEHSLFGKFWLCNRIFIVAFLGFNILTRKAGGSLSPISNVAQITSYLRNNRPLVKVHSVTSTKHLFHESFSLPGNQERCVESNAWNGSLRGLVGVQDECVGFHGIHSMGFGIWQRQCPELGVGWHQWHTLAIG